MTATPATAPDGEAVPDLESSVHEVIALCCGDPRAAIRALLVANAHLERQLDLARVAVSSGFSRGWHRRP
jgi:hypothetical protein